MVITFICFVFFFFSSRRRHTRSLCDWSSDVCSSDLADLRDRYGAMANRPRRVAGDVGRRLAGWRSCDYRSVGGLRHSDSEDRKSTRLNSSHTVISYAVFCLKKKKKNKHKQSDIIKQVPQ